MNFPWLFVINLGIISLSLLLSTLLRARIRFFQRYLIPNALTAGFLLLLFFNFISPRLSIGTQGLGNLVYHLLSISFIAMILRKGPQSTDRNRNGIMGTTVLIFFQYGMQALAGLLVTFLFIKTISPTLFPGFGFFIPLGFALGPGQAFAIGEGWRAFGFEGGGSVGLTFAAIGFLIACFGGIWIINYGKKNGWMSEEQKQRIQSRGIRTGILPQQEDKPSGMKLVTESEAIDSLSFTVAAVFGVYISTFLFLKGITFLLSFAGPLGNDLAVNLWGIHFVFAALMANLTRKIFKVTGIDYVLDNQTLTRISGLSVDFMVSAAVGAISLVIVSQYWLPILVMSVIGGLLIFLTVPYIASRIFIDHRFGRMLIIFGAVTGTMPTGLALLRIVDPDFETPVASDYVLASALIFLICIPFILAINLPAYAASKGDFMYFWIAVAVTLAYSIAGIISFLLIAKRKALLAPGKQWLKD